MLKNSGFTDSKSYDDALLNVLDEVKKLKGWLICIIYNVKTVKTKLH